MANSWLCHELMKMPGFPRVTEALERMDPGYRGNSRLSWQEDMTAAYGLQVQSP